MEVTTTRPLTTQPLDLARLFERRELSNPHGGSAVEQVAAVQRGSKALCMFAFPRSDVDDAGEEYLKVVQSALSASLTVTLRRDDRPAPREQVYVFVHREGEAWRVPAWLVTRNVLRRFPWTDALETLESTVLGYSEEEVARWIEFQRARQVDWTNRTAYILMPRACQRRIVEHGARSFPEGMVADEVLIWFASRDKSPMRRDAVALCGSDRALARVSIARGLFNEFFRGQFDGERDTALTFASPASVAASFNRCLESKIEFLFEDGWRVPGEPASPTLEQPDQG